MNRSLAALLPLRRRLLSSPAAISSSPPPKRATKKTPTPSPPKPPPCKSVEKQPEVSEDKKLAEKSLARPSEIPFQSKIVNSVHLVGRIGVPVGLQSLPNGGYAAVSVLVQEKPNIFPHFSIPIIFQGEMAQIVASYLKETDLVYVTGSLFGDVPPSGDKDSAGTIKVLVHGLNFVQQKDAMVKDGREINENGQFTSNPSEVKESSEVLHLWEDLLANPHKWWDNRSNKNSAAFRHKDTGQLLWIDESTPEWISLKLDTLSFVPKPRENIGNNSYVKKSGNDCNNMWTDLLVNSRDWWDNRLDKQNKNKPKLPDFIHKVNRKALWLDSAPDWVLAKLDGLVFSSETYTERVPKENLWRNLVDNPSEWWDNRTDKRKPNHPDFKHKVTGEALWLSSSTPQWVLPKLLAPKTKQKVGATEEYIQFTVPT